MLCKLGGVVGMIVLKKPVEIDKVRNDEVRNDDAISDFYGESLQVRSSGEEG